MAPGAGLLNWDLRTEGPWCLTVVTGWPGTHVALRAEVVRAF